MWRRRGLWGSVRGGVLVHLPVSVQVPVQVPVQVQVQVLVQVPVQVPVPVLLLVKAPRAAGLFGSPQLALAPVHRPSAR